MRKKPSVWVLLAVLNLSLFSQKDVKAQSWYQFKDAASGAESAAKFPESEDLWRKSLDSLGANPTEGSRYWQSLGGLARVLAKEKKNDEAEKLFKRALAKAKSEPNASDPDLAAILNTYAEFLKDNNRSDEAAQIATLVPATPVKDIDKQIEAVPIPAASAPAADSDSGWKAAYSAGVDAFAKKNFAAAESNLQKAFSTAKQFSLTDSRLNESINKLVILYYAQKNYQKAEPLLGLSSQIAKKTHGAQSKIYAESLMNHGKVLRLLNRKPEAVAVEAKAEQILCRDVVVQGGGGSGGAGGGDGASGFGTGVRDPGTMGGSIYNRARAAGRSYKNMLNSLED